MTSEADEPRPAGEATTPRRMQIGGRGAGGPPAGIRYGGQARQAHVPSGQRVAKAAEKPESGAPPEGTAAKRAASAKSKSGSTAPLNPLTPGSARIFESEYIVQLVGPPYGNPTGDWPMYVSAEKLADRADRAVINGIYIHRSCLPKPPPDKLRLKFEPIDSGF